jgi:hypothetical protein
VGFRIISVTITNSKTAKNSGLCFSKLNAVREMLIICSLHLNIQFWKSLEARFSTSVLMHIVKTVVSRQLDDSAMNIPFSSTRLV